MEIMREQVVDMIITTEDYETILELFDREESPTYSVIHAEKCEGEFMCIKLYVNSIVNLWYLAKKVELVNMHKKSKRDDKEKGPKADSGK